MRSVRSVPLVLALFLLPIANPVAPRDAARDGNVHWAEVLHDSRDGFFRSPGWGTTAPQRTGAVPAGAEVTLRLRTAAEDLSSAWIRVWDGARGRERWIEMAVEEPGGAGSPGRFDFWVGRVSFSHPTVASYAFVLRDGADEDWYFDDDGYGGRGRMYEDHAEFWNDFHVVFHDPSFVAPAWHKGALAYQVMLDSFRNGDPANDPVGDGRSGDVRWWEWDASGDGARGPGDGGREHARKLSPGASRAYGSGVTYYGGDFRGLAQEAGYLSRLGVGEVYLTPWMASPDYHGYAVSDYRSVEPYYGRIAARVPVGGGSTRVIADESGSLAEFHAAREALAQAGIRIVGDLVLNHAGAQSVYFQRQERAWGVPDAHPGVVGAYEDRSSPFSRWFSFDEWNHRYESWWGFRNLPVIRYDRAPGALEEMVTGEDSVLAFWSGRGVAGFRLDVANEIHDGQGSHGANRAIRAAAKALDPEAPVIGEFWGDASAWLVGDQWDGVMDYRFAFAVLDWLRGWISAEALRERLLAVEEAYPREAFLASWRLLGSHDTPRLRTELGGDRERHHLGAILQLAYPGVPLVYAGDERGMTGGADPANRGYMTWNGGDAGTLRLYEALAGLRRSDAVFGPEAGLEHLHARGATFAFARTLPASGGEEAAVVALNRGSSVVDLRFDVSAIPGLRPGSAVRDLLSGEVTFVGADGALRVTLAAKGGAILRSGACPGPGQLPGASLEDSLVRVGAWIGRGCGFPGG